MATIRVSAQLAERIKALAAKEDRTQAVIVARAIVTYESVGFAGISTEGDRPIRVTGREVNPACDQPEPNHPVDTDCPHPRNLWQKHGWGTTCGACGERVTR